MVGVRCSDVASASRPDAGRIVIDDTDLTRLSTTEWRHRTSAVFQDHAIFEFLARETVGVPDIGKVDDDEALLAALEGAGAADVLDALPHRLDSQLGTAWKNGVDLSGGQWQKLALSRGLMRTDPLLVVLDEPTAAIDAQTEHALFERFARVARAGHRRGAVTLLVSHRFSTVRMADLIVVLNGGRVIETGTHDSLAASGGLYAELYGLQAQSYT